MLLWTNSQKVHQPPTFSRKVTPDPCINLPEKYEKEIKLIQINVKFVLWIQWLTFTENWVQLMIRVKNLTYSHADVQHLNLLGTWLYMEAHTIVMTVPSNSIFHFLYYVLVFINSSSKQRKLSYLEQLKMLSRNLQLIFYFSFERQISSEKQDIQSTSSVMQHTSSIGGRWF